MPARTLDRRYPLEWRRRRPTVGRTSDAHAQRQGLSPDNGSYGRPPLGGYRYGIGLPEFQHIIDFLAPHYKAIAGRKVAILTGREHPRAGILSYAIQTLEITVASFLFTNEACAWLGVSQADISKDLQYLRERAAEGASGTTGSPAPDETS